MEFGNLEREIRIDASPEIVFAVVSRTEHKRTTEMESERNAYDARRKYPARKRQS